MLVGRQDVSCCRQEQRQSGLRRLRCVVVQFVKGHTRAPPNRLQRRWRYACKRDHHALEPRTSIQQRLGGSPLDHHVQIGRFGATHQAHSQGKQRFEPIEHRLALRPGIADAHLHVQARGSWLAGGVGGALG